MIAPILLPFFESNGLSMTQIFVTESAYLFTFLLLEIPSGYLSDIIGRKKTLIIGSLFMPLGMLTYALSGSLFLFIIAEIFFAIANTMRSGTDSAILYDTLAELKETKMYKKIEGKAHFYTATGEALAAILGGVLALVALRLPLFVNFGISLVLLPIAITLTEPKRKKVVTKEHFKKIMQIVKQTISHAKLRSIIVYSSMITSVGIIGYWTFYMYYGKLGIGIGYYGVFAAIMVIFSGLAAKYSHKIEYKIGRKKSMYLLLLISVIYLLLGLFDSVFLIPVILMNGLIWGFSIPLFMDYLNKLIKSDTRATVLSVSSMMASLGFVIISPIFGKIIDVYSLSTAHLVLSAFFLVGGSFGLFLMHKNKVI